MAEWYQDTTAGDLYYIPLSGQDMSKADVELPQLQYLLAVGGTCSPVPADGSDCVNTPRTNSTQAVPYVAPAAGDPYEHPAHDLRFVGLTFSYPSWTAPNTEGFPEQQTSTYTRGPISDHPGGGQPAVFEAWRSFWSQMPAAVQVSDAYNIAFVRDRFVDLGEVGLSIGNDANAHITGVGLGSNGIIVNGCVFSQIAASGIVIGGVQAWAHHPCGDKVCTATDLGARLINQNMTISDNIFHDIGVAYGGSVAILSTYTTNVSISHNDVYNVPYSGIATGYGWGTNDVGGEPDYRTRETGNLYLYQPTYQSATVNQNNKVTGNWIHSLMRQMNDGGCHYNLGWNHGTQVTENYCEGNGSGCAGMCIFHGEYDDEGSAYLTITKNVYSNVTGYWPNHAHGINYSNNSDVKGNGSATTKGTNFDAALQAIVNASGLEPAYSDVKP